MFLMKKIIYLIWRLFWYILYFLVFLVFVFFLFFWIKQDTTLSFDDIKNNFFEKNISLEKSLENIFDYKTNLPDKFFGHQLTNFSLQTISWQDVSLFLNTKLNTNYYLTGKIKNISDVKFKFDMLDQIWQKIFFSWEFFRLNTSDKKYFFIKTWILEGSTWVKQIKIWQDFISKLINTGFFLENWQDFGFFTKSWNMQNILSDIRLIKYIPQHLQIITWAYQETWLMKILPNFLSDYFFKSKTYNLKLQNAESLLLWLWIPVNLDMKDAIKFDANFVFNKKHSKIIFSWFSIYNFPYICSWELAQNNYFVFCKNKSISEKIKIKLTDKKCQIRYFYPEIQVILDGNYDFKVQNDKINFVFDWKLGVKNDDLLYHKFVDFDINFSVVFDDMHFDLNDNIRKNFVNPILAWSWFKSLFEIFVP